MKRILISLGAAGTALAMLPLFAAFEAHVINVTARIENALMVRRQAIDYGTVFPQEHLFEPLDIWLSNSFIDEDRVDDVEYIIRQKPKCAITSQNGEVIDPTSTATGHVSVGPSGQAVIDCGQPPRPLQPGESWGVLPMLCPYLSKEPDNQPPNDGSLPPFHQPFQIVNGQVAWTDTNGRLAKSDGDFHDNWLIDLAVPCFGGYCAQDWADFVQDKNPDAGDPNQWVQPIQNEHKIFGCDLWVEVTEVSEFSGFNEGA